MLPLLFHGDDLDRDVARQRIALQLIQYGPTEHVGQKNVQ